MSRQQDQLATARDLDHASTALLVFGVKVVKKNPIKVSLYVLGICICLFFSGFKVTLQQRQEYQQDLNKINHDELDRSEMAMKIAYNHYYGSKGWFTCSGICRQYKQEYDILKSDYDRVRLGVERTLASAKNKLGIFSEYGVDETKQVFWERFAAGKSFAKRQSMWDLIFMGIGSVARDESMFEYLIRFAVNVLINFTIGVCMAVVTFVFSLGSLLSSYQLSIFSWQGITYFCLASLAAAAFAVSWLIGLYMVAAGTAYVGFTIAKGSLRLEGGRGGSQRRDYIR